MWSSSSSQGEVEEQVLISTLVIRDRTQRKGVKLSKGMFALDIRKMFFYPEGGWALELAPQGSGHRTSLREFKKSLDNAFRTWCDSCVRSCTEPGVGLDAPDGSLPTQLIL